MRTFATFLVVFLISACSDRGGYYVAVKPGTSAPIAGSPRPPELVLPLEVDSRLAETFVRIGFGIEKGFQSTDFLTPRLRTTQAAQLIRMVKQYNEFEGERVATAVQQLRGRVSGIEFGRDGSPVLFIELPYWTHQREETLTEGMGVKIPDADNDKFIQELKLEFIEKLKASEFSVRGRRVRIWWS